MTLAQRFSLLWRRFSPLEKQLLDAVRTVLPEVAIPIYDAQVAAINHAQRLLQWNEICYYPKRLGWARRVDWSNMPKFPCTDEFQLAEVRFRVKGKRFKAILSSIEGHIFDFHIHPGGRSISFSSWDDASVVALLNDPLRAPTFKRHEKLPVAWQQFLDKHDQHPSNWKLYDGMSAYRIALEDGEYLLLAESEEDEFVMVRIDPPTEYFFYIEGHDGKPEPIHAELTSVIKDGDSTSSRSGSCDG